MICVIYLVGKLNSEAFLGIRVDHAIGNKSSWGWLGINHRPSLNAYFYWNGVGKNGSAEPSNLNVYGFNLREFARPAG